MAINTHHQVGEINNVRCSIVEQSVNSERAEYLKSILTFNGYEVEVAQKGDESFDVGVTDLLFNTEMAINGRYLKTKEGKVITPEVWKQPAKMLVESH
ncbi:hypothetical protein [Prolixibacter denitrificans]|uniref:Uncharacterized protein n=1 Tax=Prolixibacter denitrificans TaxID=1541063 RepID=A0A2P8C5Z6_9BACT|nr:hypothetical protein [Prolixibacter denitrificans]PSK80385.1 hypothetical protein CLV93_11729 [Prolixibacter denitrificans]GET23092.1 hypothetical protein JCM18694_33380 [Prolixibacter denitrificans]